VVRLALTRKKDSRRDSLPLEGKVDFSALPKKTDEVFLRKTTFFEQADDIRPNGSCDEICEFM